MMKVNVLLIHIAVKVIMILKKKKIKSEKKVYVKNHKFQLNLKFKCKKILAQIMHYYNKCSNNNNNCNNHSLNLLNNKYKASIANLYQFKIQILLFLKSQIKLARYKRSNNQCQSKRLFLNKKKKNINTNSNVYSNYNNNNKCSNKM